MYIIQILYPYIKIPVEGYGGSERVAEQITRGLVKRGHKVYLVSVGESKIKGTELHYIFPKELTLSNWNEASNVIQHDIAQKLFYTLPSDTIIHNHMGYYGMNLPNTVTTLHNDFNIPNYGIPNKNSFVAISKNQSQRLGLDKVVYNAIETEKYVYSDKKEDYMLFLGNCQPGKGVETAIQVAKDLNYKLVMCLKIDKGTDIEKYYNNTIKPMLKGTENLITIKGIVSIEEKLRLFSKAKVFLMPISWDEPFGLVMLEAMASGTPVVAYNRGSVPEVVANGKSGYIVEANNYELFRHYVGLTLKSYDEITVGYISKSCLNQAKKFSVDRMVEGYLKVYEEILK